ncbi:MAG TPA: hypothetical protein VIV13_00045 [Solirubrobacterales bacterium]
MNRWILGLVAGAISLVMAVGCGGGDDSTTAVTVTKAEFTKQANAVCAKAKKQREAAIAETDEKYYEIEGQDVSGKPANVPLEKKIGEENLNQSLLPSMKEQVAALEEIGLPEGGEAKVSKMLASYSTGIEEVEENGLEALLSAEELYDFQEEAEDYGLDCPL